MTLKEALIFARSGRSLLFLGAGFSRDTPNMHGEVMKSGRDFSDYLASKVGLPVGTGLMDTSERFLEIYDAASLVDELKREFTAQALLPHQLLMADVPWKQIYTTNYDDVVEKSYKAKHKKLNSYNPDAAVASVDQKEPACIHLNGSVIKLTPDKLANQVKLTDSSYLTSSLADSEWAIRLRQDIDAAQAVFYIGYSTYDIDIARLLYAKSALKDKSFFVVGDSADPVLQLRISKFGQDTGLGSADFFAEAVKPEYASPVASGVPEYCLRTYIPAAPIKPFRDQDVFDLFRLGRIFSPFVFEGMNSERDYVLNRRQLDLVMSLISNQPSAVAIHSLLGNGKTTFLELLKARAATEGFTVMEVLRQRDQLYEELEFALKKTTRLIFIIDNYGNWLDAIKFIGNHAAKNVSVVLAARSNTNDVLASRVATLLKMGDLREISLDHLTDAELVAVSQMMDTYGLWGDRASWPVARKHGYLRDHCHSQWQSILLELFRAPQIKQKLDALIAGIKGEETYQLVFITILLLAIIDYPATSDILTDLCGQRTLTVGFRKNETIQELVDFDSDEVRLRSSVTGAFVLKHVAEPQKVLETVIAITRAADTAAFASREYVTMLASLLRFGNAQNYFPEGDRNDKVLRYYEAVKELPHCKRYPLFWLQYAIACLFIDDFPRAEKYFASAYSYAKERNFNTFQIDNHYARFLLRRSISSNDPATAIEDFRAAKKLIIEQMRRERLHYPYRVATLIGEWYETFSDVISEEHRGEVVRTAIFISSKIAGLPEYTQKHRDVAECHRKMQQIVQGV